MNPSDKACWKTCGSCYRCGDKGRYAKCHSCSGRHDPGLQRDPYDYDDMCRCAEGVLQYRANDGRLLKKRFLSSPFASNIVTDAETKDEQEWKQYIAESRERLDDETWDPVRFTDGTSTHDWARRARVG